MNNRSMASLQHRAQQRHDCKACSQLDWCAAPAPNPPAILRESTRDEACRHNSPAHQSVHEWPILLLPPAVHSVHLRYHRHGQKDVQPRRHICLAVPHSLEHFDQEVQREPLQRPIPRQSQHQYHWQLRLQQSAARSTPSQSVELCRFFILFLSQFILSKMIFG